MLTRRLVRSDHPASHRRLTDAVSENPSAHKRRGRPCRSTDALKSERRRPPDLCWNSGSAHCEGSLTNWRHTPGRQRPYAEIRTVDLRLQAPSPHGSPSFSRRLEPACLSRASVRSARPRLHRGAGRPPMKARKASGRWNAARENALMKGQRWPARSGRHSFSVFFPDAARLTDLGFGLVAHVPVVFDERHRYCSILNRYLRERARREWHPSYLDGNALRRIDFPRSQTLRRIAYYLADFGAWLTSTKRDWTKIDYEDVLTYQQDQISGKWSAGRPLKPVTANSRADEATFFLQWAAGGGLREPFRVGRVSVSRTFQTGKSSRSLLTHSSVRPGRAKVSRTSDMDTLIALPRPEEIPQWLAAVCKRRGFAKYLACRFILEAGLRLEEVTQLTVGQLKSEDILEHLRRRGESFAPMHLVNTKGGRPRDIIIPISFAIELRNWVDTKRSTYATRYRQRVGKPPGDQLFLSDALGHQGTPLQGRTLYKVFRDIHRKPFKWYPHLGRHTFACYWLLFALEREARQHQRTFAQLGADWIQLRGEFHLNLLRQQLGHASEKTTELYLRWLISATGMEDVITEWHSYLSSSTSDERSEED